MAVVLKCVISKCQTKSHLKNHSENRIFKEEGVLKTQDLTYQSIRVLIEKGKMYLSQIFHGVFKNLNSSMLLLIRKEVKVLEKSLQKEGSMLSTLIK